MDIGPLVDAYVNALHWLALHVLNQNQIYT
jgi:hypothetical protein